MTNYGTIPTSSSEGTNEFISNAKPEVKVGIRNGRPWKEMVRSLSLPSGFRNTFERIKTNLVYFRTNYMIILLLILFLSYLYHPVSLGVFLTLLVDVYLVFYFRMLLILSSMISVILLMFTDAAAWNIISTLLIEAVIVVTHASVRKTDDLSLDEEMPLSTGISNGRPWKEMARSLNLPSGFRNTIERMKTNLDYFKINYMIILMLILGLSFLYHPVSLSIFYTLLTDILLLLYIFGKEPLLVFHRILRIFMIVLVIISVILLMFTDAAWNVISILLIEAVVVAAHASFRKTDDLFVDEELAQTGSLLTSSSS